MDDIDPDEMWFQQDGATCHTATATIDLLKSKFGDKLISRNGPVNWPPRSCDLTPLDYFMWGYVKSLVYADKLATIDALGASIVRVIRDIRPAVLENWAQNWTSRMRFVKNSRGAHMPRNHFQILMPCIDLSNNKNFWLQFNFLCYFLQFQVLSGLKKHPLCSQFCWWFVNKQKNKKKLYRSCQESNLESSDP